MRRPSHRPLFTALAAAALSLVGCLEYQTTRPAPSPKAFGYTEVDGQRVHMREMGPPEGTTPAGDVVFLHGYAGGLVSWMFTQPALAKTHRTLSLDLKGFGLTDKAEGDYSLAAEADLVAALMTQRGMQRAHVVAHSWGSAVALELARRHPDRVGKLVLTGGFVYEDQLNGFLRWSKLPVVGEMLYSLFYNAQIEARYTWSYFDPVRFSSAHEFDSLHAFQGNIPGLEAAALAVLRGMDLDALRPAFAQTQHPTLLVWGREDRVSPPPYGERLAAELPHARLVVLERCGHNVMIERRGTYEQLVAEFLAP
jgi:pimeloyl-ACP methyl ester carboxylesterase